MNPGGNALVAFEGTRLDQRTRQLMSDPRVAGVTLYRSLNIESSQQAHELISELVRSAGRPLLIAVDQEGGQLLGAGPDATAFAGNMALGATGDPGLAEEVAFAIGLELRAMGMNVDYAPVADVASRPDNPSLGIRSFGEDPSQVAAFTRAFVVGLQRAGVAATIKHFPGKGDAGVDPHEEMPVLDLDRERLENVEFAPFRAGIEAGARLLMVGHYGLPAVTGDRRIPTSASSQVMRDLLRGQLGYDGVIITDALDMGGFAGVEVEASLHAGADLLLYGPAQKRMLPDVAASKEGRVSALFGWLGGFNTPDLDVVGSERHRRLADDLAVRAMTLVRDDDGLIPLRISPGERILAIMPRPTDLTPADTSAMVAPALAEAIRRHHPDTSEIIVSRDPDRDEIAAAVESARAHDLVVVGTIEAGPGQGKLVEQILAGGVPTVTVAMRTPYDLAVYPSASTHLCSYGILPPTMRALAAVLFGAPVGGRLPVSIPGLYPVGHGVSRTGDR